MQRFLQLVPGTNGKDGDMLGVRLRDMGAILTQFVAARRGLRLGRLFGRPAAYAGRRVFARVSERGLEVKLPASAYEAAVRAGAAVPTARRSRRDEWTVLRAGTAMSGPAVGSWLELGARHAAEMTATPAGRNPSMRSGGHAANSTIRR